MADRMKLRVTGLSKAAVQEAIEETLGQEASLEVTDGLPTQEPGTWSSTMDLFRHGSEIVEATITATAISKVLYGQIKQALEKHGAKDVDWRNSEGYL